MARPRPLQPLSQQPPSGPFLNPISACLNTPSASASHSSLLTSIATPTPAPSLHRTRRRFPVRPPSSSLQHSEEQKDSPDFPDHYATLSLDPSCTISEIKDAYRRLRQVYFEAGDAMRYRGVGAAYAVLVEGEGRRVYDAEYRTKFGSGQAAEGAEKTSGAEGAAAMMSACTMENGRDKEIETEDGGQSEASMFSMSGSESASSIGTSVSSATGGAHPSVALREDCPAGNVAARRQFLERFKTVPLTTPKEKEKDERRDQGQPRSHDSNRALKNFKTIPRLQNAKEKMNEVGTPQPSSDPNLAPGQSDDQPAQRRPCDPNYALKHHKRVFEPVFGTRSYWSFVPILQAYEGRARHPTLFCRRPKYLGAMAVMALPA